MWANMEDNKVQSVQVLYSCVAVIRIHQEAGNYGYTPSNEAQ
jgi:hypothetical protein